MAACRQLYERGGGGCFLLFSRSNGTFMTMLIKCFWDGAPHTRLEQLDWALGAVFMDAWINTLPEGLYLSLS